ncbi:uncharacterized protein DSM5745_08769 [Aspergillus mulundensis]|uniref:Uncharacterized protein n=1 Tax=Aspergillus mulundensis TaxID=1810919 RepID=A0A3D8R4R0_9EURO|nr:hypothetical protein DSM5745_08769 [Aspergillus mulundensis]RDW69009.1 hypothetical protein DSM5745_08769 [Aspergillus mulundensis]
MPFSLACTSPRQLCSECKPIYARLVREAYGKWEPEDIFPSPRVYPIGFAKRFSLEVPSKATLDKHICQVLKGDHLADPKLHWLITRSKDGKGQSSVKVFVLVDVEDSVEVTKDLMQKIFGEIDGGAKGWKYEVFGDIQECQTLQRLLFFEHKLLRK